MKIHLYVSGRHVVGTIDARFSQPRITWTAGRTYLGTFGRSDIGTYDDLALLMSLVARAMAIADGNATLRARAQSSIDSLVTA